MHELPESSMAALQRLARGLLYDRDRARDLVQEAWLAALEKEPPASGLFGWLAGATRRLARDARREDARRRERERQAARGERLPGEDEVTGRIEILHRVLDAVNALDEPYKSAVALRYLEDQPPREIARRLGLPVNTVRTHVRRGLERLRRQLDGERGRRGQDFLAVLAPLAGRKPWSLALGQPANPLVVPTTVGGFLVKNKSMLALFLVLLAGSTWFVLRELGEPEARARQGEVALAAPVSEPAPTPRGPAVEPATGSASERAPLSSSSAVNASWIVRGHVTRGEWEPYPRVRLVGRVHAGAAWDRVRPTGTLLLEQRFLADERGNFAWAIKPPTRLVTVFVEPDIEDHETSSTGDAFLPGDPAPDKFLISAAPLDCTLHGVVRDLERKPVEGVRVSREYELDDRGTTTDNDGRYALLVPSLIGIDLEFFASGFARRKLEVGQVSPGEVDVPEVVLEPELRVEGSVVDEDGEPVAGARVCPTPFYFHDDLATGTDENGRFELGTFAPDSRGVEISVRKPGFVQVNRFIPLFEGRPIDLLRIELERGVRVTGRVVSPEGHPVEGTWISVGSHYAEPRIEARSNAEGRFVLTNVSRGEQPFWFWRAGFAHLRQEIEVPEGVGSLDGLEIVLGRSHFVGGIVLAADGKPIPWARVSVDDPEPPPDIEGFRSYSGPDGRFRIDGLPDQPLLVGAWASGHVTLREEVRNLDREDLVLRLRRFAGLAGLALDEVSGAPLESFTVELLDLLPPREDSPVKYELALQAAFSRRSPVRHQRFRDTEGIWSFGELDPDRRLAVLVTAEGRAPAFACEVSPSSVPRAEDLVLRLGPGSVLLGTVVDAVDRTPLSGVEIGCAPADVRCARAPTLHLLKTTTDADGRFRLEGLAAGSLNLEATRSDRVRGRVVVVVSEQGEASVVVELRKQP